MEVPFNQQVMGSNDQFSSDIPAQTVNMTRDNVSQVATTTLAAPNQATASASSLEMKTVVIAKSAFQLNDMFPTAMPLVHVMGSLSFDSVFFKTLVLYLNDYRNPAPLPTTDQDLACLEYMFFKSFNNENQKANNLIRARHIVELMGQHRPNDPSTRMAMAYLACADFNIIYSYAQVSDFINKAKIVNPKSIELPLLLFWAAKQEGDVSTILAASLMLSQLDRSFDSAPILANYLHDPQVLTTMIMICGVTSSDATGYELQLLLLNKEYKDALNKARVWLKEKPSVLARHCIMRALLKLNRIEECEAFVRSEKMHKDHLVQALVHSAKKQDANAYQSFIRYFHEENNKKTVQYWTVLELCEVLERLKPAVDDVIMTTLARAAETDRGNVQIARQAFFCSLRLYLSPDTKFTRMRFPHPGQCLLQVVRIHPEKANRYNLMYAKYLMDVKDSKNSVIAADSLYKKVLPSPEVDQEVILELADLLARQGRREMELALLKEHYEATYNEEYLQKYVNCMQFLRIDHLAVEVVAKHVAKFPNSVHANVLHACFLDNNGRYDEAMVAVNKVLSLDPQNQYALILRSDLFFRINDYQRCVDDYLKSTVSTNPAVALLAIKNLPKVFKSYLELNRLSSAKKLLKDPNSEFAISEQLRQEYAAKVRAKKEKKEKPIPTDHGVAVQGTQSDSAVQPLPAQASPVRTPEAVSETKTQSAAGPRAEPVRNVVPQAPVHLQSSKKDVTNLDAHAKLKAWSNNPSLLSNACTIDPEVYGISRKPVPAAAGPSYKESFVEQRLTLDEQNRLEIAHQAIIQIGDLLRQEKERCSPNPNDPGNFLFPRAFAYHVLKFSEALSPTSSNRKDVSEAFKSTVQTHILSMKLIVALRHAMRHEFQLVDFKKLKVLGHELASSTVKENIKAYRDQAAPKEIKGKEPKEVLVSFQERTTISKKQEITNQAKPDYFQEANDELIGMVRVTKKFVESGMLSDVLKENFYMDGLKMSVCNIEECVKRLGGSDDPELRDILYFGNRVAHEMGDNPKLYVNEEISPQRMLRIINKAESILARIKLIAKR